MHCVHLFLQSSFFGSYQYYYELKNVRIQEKNPPGNNYLDYKYQLSSSKVF